MLLLCCITIIVLLSIYAINLIRHNIKLQRKLDNIAYWISSIDENELNHSLHDKRYLKEALKIVNQEI
jgi:hypothetical protein